MELLQSTPEKNTEFQNEIFSSVLFLTTLISPVLLKSAITVLEKLLIKLVNCSFKSQVSFGAFFICVCCGCVIYSCACAFVYAEVREGCLVSSIVLPLVSLIQDLSELEASSLFPLGWLASKLLGSTCLFP